MWLEIIIVILIILIFYFAFADRSEHYQPGPVPHTPQVVDEIHFWGRQLTEHALFLHLGIEEPSLKARGLKLHKRWQSFMDRFKAVSADKIVLDADDFKVLGDLKALRLDDIVPLWNDLRAYKLELLVRLRKGEWLGWIYDLFVVHVLRELHYLGNKMWGRPLPLIKEVEFWNATNGEHAAFAAHLLDPAKENRELITRADEFYQTFSALSQPEQSMLVHMSLNHSVELDNFNRAAQKAIKDKRKPLKSLIHPVLIDHVIREGERSIWALKKMQGASAA